MYQLVFGVVGGVGGGGGGGDGGVDGGGGVKFDHQPHPSQLLLWI